MQIASRTEPPLLTPRQLEVLELMAKGLPNREIAGVLGIAPATVKRHVSSVIEALDVTNRTEAVTALHELGLGNARSPSNPDHRVPGFGERPAIAVLPFDNFSSDPDQGHFADGIVEDLITRLSGWRWFPVIARNSTFVYKGRAVDVKEVSRVLGAAYVVEGSVRRAGDRVRITVQLLDGETGQHVWADRYDRALAEVFALEDEIVDTIVASLEPAMMKIQGLRALPKHPESLGAWELFHRGFLRLTDGSWEGVLEACRLSERAAELHPHMALAWAGLAISEFHQLIHQRASDPTRTEARVIECARRAVELDPNEPLAHMALGWAWIFSRCPEEGLTAQQRALELNPSFAWAHWAHGTALCALDTERVDEGIASLKKAIRLSPQDPFLPFVLQFLGVAYLVKGRVDEAEAALERSRRMAPDQPHSYPLLAACHVLRGQIEEARAHIARMEELHRGYSPLAHARRFAPPTQHAGYAALLEAAGWREEQGSGPR